MSILIFAGIKFFRLVPGDLEIPQIISAESDKFPGAPQAGTQLNILLRRNFQVLQLSDFNTAQRGSDKTNDQAGPAVRQRAVSRNTEKATS